MDQAEAPIVDALQAYKTQGTTSFGVPGHESGVGATEDVKRLLGPGIFAAGFEHAEGIPRLVPDGLTIGTHVACFRRGLEAGHFPMGQSDMRLHTLRVAA